MSYKFSKRSINNLNSCDKKLQEIAKLAITKIDFTIIQGHRTLEQQRKYFKEGKSWTLQSKHLKSPSLAFDFIPSPFNGWKDAKGFEKIGKVLLECAKELNIEARWGGDWNRNNSYKDEIERGSYDGGHFELI